MTWRAGLLYSGAGLAMCRANPRLFVALPALFCLPIVVALILLVAVPGALWLGAVGFILTGTTVVGGHLTLLIAVDAVASGQRIGLIGVLTRSVRDLPRYLLTNAQTTIVFWAVMLPLATIVSRVADGRPPLVGAVLWMLLVAFGLTWHLQTLFAPYIAICARLAPPLAVLEGFRLVRGRLGTTATTFVSAAAFAGLPSLVVIAALHEIAAHEGPAAVARFDQALPYLATGLVELIRPVLVASVHRLYGDLWRARAETLDVEPVLGEAR